MSLKAKIEAVIYASEEPVTLAQLAGLLGDEAQAELDALASQQESLPLEESADADDPNAGDPDALNAETLGDDTVGDTGAETGAEISPVQADADTEPVMAAAEPVAPSEETASGDPAAVPPPAAETDAENPASAPEEAQPSAAVAAEVAQVASAAATRARERRLREYFRSLLDQLISDYDKDDRGLEIREVAGGFRLATKPEYHDAVRGFVKSLKPPLKLSLQALETLAVVAYKQPITAPEVSEIRGVDSGGVLGSLMARKLVATAGRKQVIGRPILYKTTKEFLVRFGLKDLNELPSIEEFERMAGEFAEAVQEEIPMDSGVRRSEEDPTAGSHLGDPSEVEPMANQHEAQADGVPDSPDRPYSEENVNEENPSAVEDPAEEVLIDGRLSGLPPNYSRDEYVEGDGADSPAIDAEVQSGSKDGGA